ncbi:hypothetical protein MKW92_027646, partial [Papaver armeniacum]
FTLTASHTLISHYPTLCLVLYHHWLILVVKVVGILALASTCSLEVQFLLKLVPC